MKTAFFWGMLGCVGGMLILTAVIPSARVTARPMMMPIEEAKEERVQSWSIPGVGVKTMRVKIQTGSLRVIAGQTKEIVVRARRIVRAKNGTIAKELLLSLPMSVVHKGGEVLINDLRLTRDLTGGPGMPRVELEVDITAPTGIALEASVAAGNTRLLGRLGKVALQTQVGNVTLERQQGITGDIAVGTGCVTLSGEVGNLAVQARTGEIWAARVQASQADSLSVRAGTGNIWMSLDQLPKHQLIAQTHTGDVVVQVPTKKGAPGPKLTALADLGTSRLDYGITPQPLGALGPTAQ